MLSLEFGGENESEFKKHFLAGDKSDHSPTIKVTSEELAYKPKSVTFNVYEEVFPEKAKAEQHNPGNC